MKDTDLEQYIADILEQVRRRGDKALLYYTRKFDKAALTANQLKIPLSSIRKSKDQVDPLLRKALEQAAANIALFHKTELKNSRQTWMKRESGRTVGQIAQPVEKAGIYVPGGRYSYPSTVLMTAIPAKVAGVKTVIMVTPPKNITPTVLYAACISGVDEIYQVGGPAAIGALAYGTDTVPNVDMIIGPGNAYVNEAKRQVFGRVGIDSLAGPSEVAIVADKTAEPEYVAADLLAQMEHDPSAKAYLFTDSETILRQVKALVGKTDLSLKGRCYLEKCSLSQAVEKVNRLAPEHLELQVASPGKIARRIRNAGAIFAGKYTPTAIGDYWAGPSHTLPTSAAARFSSGVSCMTFIKRTSYIEYTPESLKRSALPVETIAEAEGLKYHRDSVRARTK